ncbi:DUF202 domain-containing protein, partial [Cellulomonas hominis]
MTAADPPPGADPERTALSWRRTALSVAVGALVAGRTLEPWFGPPVWVATALGLLGAAAMSRVGLRRTAAWAAVVDDARADRARVRVPATSANLGPGFDALGLALALH